MMPQPIDPKSLEELRPLLSKQGDSLHKNVLGQIFTGMKTGRLLAALAYSPAYNKILDPMAGHGDLLEAIAERYSFENKMAELYGVEIDPSIAELGKRRLSLCSNEYKIKGEMNCNNAFNIHTWENSMDPPFDLVITNPPYVRYQTQSRANKLKGINVSSANEIRKSLVALSEKIADDTERPILDRLIKSYSGLADLSLPSWLLCGLLIKPGGILAIVVPQMWLNRDYALLIRYYYLRYFDPIFVIEESGQRWFENVLVPVSLVLGRRLEPKKVVIPLCERTRENPSATFVEVTSQAASGISHVGRAFPGKDPEGQFRSWILKPKGPKKMGLVIRQIPWHDQLNDLHRKCKKTKWYSDLEGGRSQFSISMGLEESNMPQTIREIFPAGLIPNTQSFEATPIKVGQGLRTGCNKFFYVEIEGEPNALNNITVKTSDLFGQIKFPVPYSVLRPVLRRQAEYHGFCIRANTLNGRVLDLRDYLLPEDFNDRTAGLSLNETNPNGFHCMPTELANYVRLAAHTYLVRGHRKVLIPDLSAVKPNGQSSKSLMISGYENKPVTLKKWYMLPNFAKRHMAAVFLPRIIQGSPKAIINDYPPAIIDANFSTLWPDNSSISEYAIFSLFNSIWVELCIELMGTPLGGGALKLEATHIRQFPLPVLTKRHLSELTKLGMKLRKDPGRRLVELHEQIDLIVLGGICGSALNTSFLNELRCQIKKRVQAARGKRILNKVKES
jgi:hypothetical protein